MTDKSEKIDFNPPSSSIKKKNSIISNLKEGQVSNSIDVELITKIKQVKEENDRLNKELQNCIKIVEENKKLKERVKNQDKEIAILEEKINLYDSAQAKNEEELVEEIRTELEESFKEKITSLTNEVTKLNKELSDKNVKLSTLEVTLSESKSTIDNLTNLNKNLQEQVTKRSTSDLFEMDNLMEKISKLEGEKEEQNQRIKELTDQLQNYSTNYSSISFISSNEVNGVPEYKKALTHLKHELKVQIKKNEETKLELESQIKQKEIEIAKGEAKIKELENTIEIIVNENDEVKKENEELHFQIIKLNESNSTKGDIEEMTKLKSALEKEKKEHTSKIEELNNKITEGEKLIEKYKNLEVVYKNQLNEKNKDSESKTNFINEIQTCLNKQIDDNLKLKQDNVKLSNEKNILQKKNDEINQKLTSISLELNEKKNTIDKTINDLNENIKKKKKIISNKKRENLILADIVNGKRSEIQCIEALQYVQCDSIKVNLNKLREKEKECIKQIEDLTNDPYYTDDSIDEDDSLDFEDDLSEGDNKINE